MSARSVLRSLFTAGSLFRLGIASAVAVGMLPPLPLDRFRQVGNAAGAGARMSLVSMVKRREAEDLARRIETRRMAKAGDDALLD